jgi:hypothetical protein
MANGANAWKMEKKKKQKDSVHDATKRAKSETFC